MTISNQQLRARLAREVRTVGSQSIWAAQHGFSVSYVNDLLHGRKDFSGTAAQALGYQRHVTYRRINGKRRSSRPRS